MYSASLHAQTQKGDLYNLKYTNFWLLPHTHIFMQLWTDAPVKA